jgi:histidinol-phosphatase (PHP family)
MINLLWFEPSVMVDDKKSGSILADFHVHSSFSPDASDSLDQMCQHALRSGFLEIAFTEHIEWHPDWKGAFDIKSYFKMIQVMKERYAHQGLTVYTGVEIGNPHEHPDETSALLTEYQFDVVIGSLHWLSGTNIHLTECFYQRDATDVYAEYFLEITKMSECCDFDILAHFDRLFWPGWKLNQLPNLVKLEPIIRSMVSSLVEKEQLLELNTKFLTLSPEWRNKLLTILRWYLEAGGRGIIISSDAHRKSEIGRNFDIAEQMVKKADLVEFYPYPTFLFGNRSRLVTC